MWRLPLALALMLATAAGAILLSLLIGNRPARADGPPHGQATPIPAIGTEAQYGGGPRRLRAGPGFPLPGQGSRIAWRARVGTLLEFPPAVAQGVVTIHGHDGRLAAWRARDGQRMWARRFGKLAATSPAISHGMVIAVSFDGRVGAFDMWSGRGVWQRRLGARSESSPLIMGQTVYIGDYGGRVWALNIRTGNARWVAPGHGRIKSALAGDGKVVVVGDYDGAVHMLAARTGRPLWSWQGTGEGTFYANPVLARGRVIVANTDGYVAALDRRGRELWRTAIAQPDQWVHSSPAVAHGMVYVGDYGGRIWALDVRTGKIHWRFDDSGGRISGSPTVIGRHLYAARLWDARTGQAKRMMILDALNGSLLKERPMGRYTPAVMADGQMYLIGHNTIEAWSPTSAGNPAASLAAGGSPLTAQRAAPSRG